MMSKTRGISIKRTETIIESDKNGNPVEKKQVRWFPCKVNAAVPFDHRMLK